MKLLAEVKTETSAPTASDLAPSRAQRHSRRAGAARDGDMYHASARHFVRPRC